MPTTDTLPVKDLKLDLRNYRTTPQKNETHAIRALIAGNPDWFWALALSLLDDGYLTTENILVMKGSDGFTVKEGNRRVAVLKLCFGLARRLGLAIPSDIEEKIKAVDAKWKTANKDVPCAIYSPSEAIAVDRIVTLTHGKGEQAGRANWQAVARARHNRDASGSNEPALDLLESYLKHGSNLTNNQKERWAADYPLSVLEEAMKRVAPRLSFRTITELADSYPNKLQKRTALEELLSDIGRKSLQFPNLRDKSVDVLATRYGIKEPAPTSPTPSAAGPAGAGAAAGAAAPPASTSAARKARAAGTTDPRSVRRVLSRFRPAGKRREKVVTLLEELRGLNLSKHPHAFCFLLRSMFEISAKAYCSDHSASGGPKATKSGGEDRALVDVLRDITQHLTKNQTDRAALKRLHGAIAELATAAGFLSVTSMNQLVHSPSFSVADHHICTLFHNIFPLLEAMNE